MRARGSEHSHPGGLRCKLPPPGWATVTAGRESAKVGSISVLSGCHALRQGVVTVEGLNSESHRHLSDGVEKWVMKEGAKMGYKVAVGGKSHGTDQKLTNLPRSGPMANYFRHCRPYGLCHNCSA